MTSKDAIKVKKLINKSLQLKSDCSPNNIQAVSIGYDCVLFDKFTGEQIRNSFGRTGSAMVEECTVGVASRNIDRIPGLLSELASIGALNVEEIYLSTEIITIAGLDNEQLSGMNKQFMEKVVVDKDFSKELFGIEESILNIFKRLKIIVLGTCEIAIAHANSNWVTTKDGKTLACRVWNVEEKKYSEDEQLYRYVVKYNKKYFGEA